MTLNIRGDLALGFVLSCLLTAWTTAPAAAAAGRGFETAVGQFRIAVDHHDVSVSPRNGTSPSVDLHAAFESWDPATRTHSISVAVENIGPATLFAEIPSVVHHLSPSGVEPTNTDEGDGPDSWAWVYDEPELGGLSILQTGVTTNARVWSFSLPPHVRRYRVYVNAYAGMPLAAGEGGTVHGPDGTAVTVDPGSTDYEALVDVMPLDESDLDAPFGENEHGGSIELTFAPAVPGALFRSFFTTKLIIPAPPAPPTTEYVVGQESEVDDTSGDGTVSKLIFTDTATVDGDTLATDGMESLGLTGTSTTGKFSFLSQLGSGFVAGVVTDDAGPRAGVVISNDTNTLVAITNDDGEYTIYVDGGPFRLYAFDPLQRIGEFVDGSILVDGETVTEHIQLRALADPPLTRDGIRNGGLERKYLSSWTLQGRGAASNDFGPTSTGVRIQPSEGGWMTELSTGAGSMGGHTRLVQPFRVPVGAHSLRLDYSFISEEFPEFVGTSFDDSFRASVKTPNGVTTFAQVSVNASGGADPIGDCGFPDGDQTCGATPWREAAVDLSEWAGTGDVLELRLSVANEGHPDHDYDSHVLVDNIRFSTLWLDVKRIAGADASVRRVRREVVQATEILSQAGINVRLRGDAPTVVADPGGLLDTDGTWSMEMVGGVSKGVRTAEETELLGLARSPVPTDLNVYYVRSLEGVASLGLAVGPDDFHDTPILTHGGVIMTDVRRLDDLAHDIAHVLISTDRYDDALEHGIGSPTNLLYAPRTVPRTVLAPDQSENMNRPGAPLLLP